MTTQYLVLKLSTDTGMTMLDRVFRIEKDAQAYAQGTGGRVVPNNGEEIVIRDTYHYCRDKLGWFKYLVDNKIKHVYRALHHPNREQNNEPDLYSKQES